MLELRRDGGHVGENNRRVLTAYSRFTTPAELVLELAEGGYRKIGTRADATREDRLRVIETILPEELPGLTGLEVQARWPEGCEIPKPTERTIGNDLKEGASRWRWQRTGKGIAHDRYRYHREPESCRATPPSIGAGQDPDEARPADSAENKAIEPNGGRIS